MKAKTNHSPKILRGLSNVLEFGKHKGKTVEQVMKDEPNWLHWALQNIPEFKLNRNALLILPPLKKVPFAGKYGIQDADDRFYHDLDQW